MDSRQHLGLGGGRQGGAGLGRECGGWTRVPGDDIQAAHTMQGLPPDAERREGADLESH